MISLIFWLLSIWMDFSRTDVSNKWRKEVLTYVSKRTMYVIWKFEIISILCRISAYLSLRVGKISMNTLSISVYNKRREIFILVRLCDTSLCTCFINSKKWNNPIFSPFLSLFLSKIAWNFKSISYKPHSEYLCWVTNL